MTLHAWVYVEGLLVRFRDALCAEWRAIALGAFYGWAFGVIAGAFVLVALEQAGAITRNTSDSIAIAWMLACPYVGGLVAYRRSIR